MVRVVSEVSRTLSTASRKVLKGFRNFRRQFLPGLGQHNLPRLSDEERLANILFQQFHLIADRRLRHAQFLTGLGEAEMPGGGFEHAQGIQGNWRDIFMDKFSLCQLPKVSLVLSGKQSILAQFIN